MSRLPTHLLNTGKKYLLVFNKKWKLQRVSTDTVLKPPSSRVTPTTLLNPKPGVVPSLQPSSSVMSIVKNSDHDIGGQGRFLKWDASYLVAQVANNHMNAILVRPSFQVKLGRLPSSTSSNPLIMRLVPTRG